MDTDRKGGLSRRDFLKAAGLAAGSAILAACTPSSVVPAIEAGANTPDLIPNDLQRFALRPASVLNTGAPMVADLRSDVSDLVTQHGGVKQFGTLQFSDGARSIALPTINGNQRFVVAVAYDDTIIPAHILDPNVVDPELLKPENLLRYLVDGPTMRAAVFSNPDAGVNFPLDRVVNATPIDDALASNGFNRSQVSNLRLIQGPPTKGGAKMLFELRMVDGSVIFGEGPKGIISKADQALYHPSLRHSDELILRSFKPNEVVDGLFGGQVLTGPEATYTPVARIAVGGDRYAVVVANVTAKDGKPLGAFFGYRNGLQGATSPLYTCYSPDRAVSNLTGVANPRRSFTAAVVAFDSLALKMRGIEGSIIDVGGKEIPVNDWLEAGMVQKTRWLVEAGAVMDPLPETVKTNTVGAKLGGGLLSFSVVGLITSNWGQIADDWKFGDKPDFWAVMDKVGASLLNMAPMTPAAEQLMYPWRTGFFNLNEMKTDDNTLLVVSPENPIAAHYLDVVGPRLLAAKILDENNNEQLQLLPLDRTVEVSTITGGEEEVVKIDIEELAPVEVESTLVPSIPTHDEFNAVIRSVNDINPKHPELSFPPNWVVTRVYENYYVGEDDKRYEKFAKGVKQVHVVDSVYVVVFQDPSGTKKVYAADVFYVEDISAIS